MISRPMTIVLVEDDAQLRKLLRITLESNPNVTVIEAGTLLEGAEIVRNCPTFVAVVDLDLPDARPNYAESVAAIRMVSPRIPIIAITGHANDCSEAAMRAGANKVISKGPNSLTVDAFKTELRDAVLAAETKGIYEPPIECLEACQRIKTELQVKAKEAMTTLTKH